MSNKFPDFNTPNMPSVTDNDFTVAVDNVLARLPGIDQLYPSQEEVLRLLVKGENIFVTSPTNSGKSLAPIILPSILLELTKVGYEFPPDSKTLFVTQLNSIQLSLLSSMSSLGIKCGGVTSDNVRDLLRSDTQVLLVGPEVLKQPNVTKMLLGFRTSFVCKVVDEAHLGKNCNTVIRSLVLGRANILDLD